MKKIPFLFLLILSSCASRSLMLTSKNTVFTLGTLHNYMLDHPHYDLRQFIGVMLGFQPTLILTEVRKDFPGAIEGSIDGGIEQSIVGAYGKWKAIPVVAVDWFDDDLMRQMKQEDANASSEFERQGKPLEAEYEKIFKTGKLLEIEANETQKKVQQIYELKERFGLLASRKRNDKICSNILSALENVNQQRVLIVFGLDHKYFIDQCVSASGQKVLDASVLLNKPELASLQVPTPLLEMSLRNLLEAKNLLKKRIADKYYAVDTGAWAVPKLKRFDDWIAKLSFYLGDASTKH